MLKIILLVRSKTLKIMIFFWKFQRPWIKLNMARNRNSRNSNNKAKSAPTKSKKSVTPKSNKDSVSPKSNKDSVPPKSKEPVEVCKIIKKCDD